ncbi:MAG: hypothetical protein J6B12_03255 [Clostridia bacterium]|nr:hypothetical protein [Clostridia bacterium]
MSGRGALWLVRWLFCRFLCMIAFVALLVLCVDWLASWREWLVPMALALCFGNF